MNRLPLVITEVTIIPLSRVASISIQLKKSQITTKMITLRSCLLFI